MSRLPADLDLNWLARETQQIGGMTLQKTVAWARLSGVAELTAPSLSDRLHQSVGFFAEIVNRLLAARPPPETSLWHGLCLHRCDSSSIGQPGSKGTDWRVHAVYDLGRGGFNYLELTEAKGAETVNRGAPVAGSVTIADRGYAKAGEMAAFLDAGDGDCPRDFIVRAGWNTLRLEAMDGTPFDPIAALTRMETDPDRSPREWNIQAPHGRYKRIRRLPIRLAILPLPPDKVEIARETARRAASKHRNKIDPRSLLAAGVHDALDLVAPGYPRRRDMRGLPPATENRTGLQAVEIADRDRPNTNPLRGGEPELALSAPRPGTADRRRLPGNPGIFPPVDPAGDEPVPSIRSIQRVVLQLLCAAPMPANFTLRDLLEADRITFRLLAEAKRKRRRQMNFSRKCLS